MPRHLPSLAGTAIAAVVAAHPALAAPVIGYNFTEIASSTQTPGLTTAVPPDVNNSGTVAFFARPGGRPAILTGDGGALTTVFSGGGVYASFSSPSIAHTGTVTTVGVLSNTGQDRLLAGNGGPVGIVTDTNGSPFSDLFIAMSSGNGRTAFMALPDVGAFPGVSGLSIFAGNGASFTPIATTAGASPFSGFDAYTAINDSGTTAFRATLKGGGHGIFTGDGGATTSVIKTGTEFRDGQTFGYIAPQMDINNDGTVAFLGLNPSFTDGGIFTIGDDGLNTILLASELDDALVSIGPPAVNAHGEVAFLAGFASGLSGIFTGDDPLADKVIAVGDPLFGSVLASFHFFKGFNDEGQVAFRATLADGRTVIARADPIEAAVAEPSPLLLLCAGLLVFVRAARGRRTPAPSRAGPERPDRDRRSLRRPSE
jgi:hypothetical protein